MSQSRVWNVLSRAIATRAFAIVTVAVFVLQSGWLAIVSRSSIYDEAYHLKIIQYFATKSTPFAHQPATLEGVGDVSRYGSYLYHYLLSWPYRWLAGAGAGNFSTWIALRLITVLISAAALVVVRQVLLELGASCGQANISMAVTSLTPLLVVLAGVVNYDNLLFLMVAVFLLYAVRLCKTDHFDPGSWFGLLAAGGFASVTKYVFLPILAVVGVWVAVRQIIAFHGSWLASTRDYFGRTAARAGVRVRRVAVAVLAAGGIAVFVERYVVNIFVYGSPNPGCQRVQSLAVCSTYAPWERNEQLEKTYSAVPMTAGRAISFLTHQWWPQMSENLTYFGVVRANGTLAATYGPSILGQIVLWGVPLVVGLVVVGFPLIRKAPGVTMILAGCGGYVAALFVRNLSDFLHTGSPMGIQGRYLLVVLPYAIGLSCMVLGRILERRDATTQRWKVFLLVLAILGAPQGGGMLSYLQSSDRDWLNLPDGAVSTITVRGQEFARRIVVPDRLVFDPRSLGTSGPS